MLRVEPAVDQQVDAGHVGRALRAQERDHVAELLGRPQAPDRDVGLRMSSAAPRAACRPCSRCGPSRSARARRCSAGCRRFASSRDSVLNAPTAAEPVAVREHQPRDRLLGRDRGDVHDAAPATRRACRARPPRSAPSAPARGCDRRSPTARARTTAGRRAAARRCWSRGCRPGRAPRAPSARARAALEGLRVGREAAHVGAGLRAQLGGRLLDPVGGAAARSRRALPRARATPPSRGRAPCSRPSRARPCPRCRGPTGQPAVAACGLVKSWTS